MPFQPPWLSALLFILPPLPFLFLPDGGFWQFFRPPFHSTECSVWAAGLSTVLLWQLFLCPVPNWFLKAPQLPVAGVNPNLSWCQTWLVSTLCCHCCCLPASMNEFLQQTSSSTWLGAKHQVSKGVCSHKRMSECIRQPEDTLRQQGWKLSMVSVSCQNLSCFWQKKPAFPHRKEKPLL